MQIVSGDITRDITGEIVYLKAYKQMVGEVTEYSTSKNTATVKLCDTGLEITVSLDDIESTGSTQPHRAFNSEVHILGTRYSIRIIDEDDYRYDREADGWCDPSVKEILIFNYKQSAESVKDLVAYQKKVLRHEIVHAFLYESGLWQNAYGSKCWAKNEEMIDWMAIQIPKIQRAYKGRTVMSDLGRCKHTLYILKHKPEYTKGWGWRCRYCGRTYKDLREEAEYKERERRSRTW